MDFKTGDTNLIRKINRALILKVVREQGPISRADIAKILKLNPATVSSNIKLLIHEKMIKDLGPGDSSGGRRPLLLCINEASFNCIGVDVQKEKIVTAAVNLEGTIISKDEKFIAYPIVRDQIISSIIDSIQYTIDNSAVEKNRYFGIGIGMHGIVNHKEGISVYAPAFSWRNVDLKKIVENAFHLPVSIDNDARVMALGEKWFGRAGKIENFVFINVGSGIGSGIMIGGEIYRGTGGAAGEVGHIRVVENGIKCVCGKFGCLDTVASEKSLVRTIVSSIQMGYKTCISDMAGNDLEKIDWTLIHKAAKLGDVLALKAFEQIGRYLGIAIADLVNILNPEMVVIGGTMSRAGDFFMESLKDTLKTQAMGDCLNNVAIIQSSLNENSGIIGAAAMVIQSLFKGPQVK